MRETTFKIQRQGSVRFSHLTGYMLVGDKDAVCFYIDPAERAYVSASTTSDNGCPVVFLTDQKCEDTEVPDTEVEFSEFPGWRFHAGGGGKSIAIALVRRGAEDE
jgi:hypothetical protein